MGITAFSIKLLDEVIEKNNSKTVMELGAQNLYNQPALPAPYAHEYYEAKGLKYECIDLSKENNCIVMDLSIPQTIGEQYDLVTDFGTSEHVGVDGKHSIEAYYNCWNTKHGLLSVNGVMVNENPKTGNWIGHGFNYVDKGFYELLCEAQGYELIELGEHPAMGNVTDGWNVYCIFRKVNSNPFISLDEFKKLGTKTS